MKPSAKGAYDEEGRRKYLSRAEGCAFIQNAARLPKPSALFCLTLYYTGCRISEALTLRRQDVDSEVKTILIRSLKKRQKREIRRIRTFGVCYQTVMAWVGGKNQATARLRGHPAARSER